MGGEFHQVFKVLYQLENGDICIGLYICVLEIGRDVEDKDIALDMCRCKLLNQTCHRFRRGSGSGRRRAVFGCGDFPVELCHEGLRDMRVGI